MHGRPREYKNKLKDPQAAEAHRKKVETIKQATTLVLNCRQAKRYDDSAMVATAKLLKIIPELYTLWNYRREALETVFEAGGEAAQKASDTELMLTQACIQENPKSYSSWHHRKWVVQKGLCSLDMELRLVSRALEEDERNFHAWNYRQFVVRLAGRTAQEELVYTEEKVCQNFSNYSAWHYRSILLPKMYCEEVPTVTFEDLLAGRTAAPAAGGDDKSALHGSATQRQPVPVHVLDQEYDMLHQAFATDSKDQSPWMYYRWLVGNSLAHLQRARGAAGEEGARETLAAVLSREAQRLREDHLSAEPDAKWPLLTLARITEAQLALGLYEGSEEEAREQVASMYRRLAVLDPLRRGFYQDAVAGRAYVVINALGTT